VRQKAGVRNSDSVSGSGQSNESGLIRSSSFAARAMGFTGGVMGLGPTQGDEKRLSFGDYSPWKRRPPLCHLDRSAAQWRDLCVDAPSWECFSTEESWALGPPKVTKNAQVRQFADALLEMSRLLERRSGLFSLVAVRQFDANRPQTAYARFLNPTVGLWEDAATGTAAGPLEQSTKMGRRSILRIR